LPRRQRCEQNFTSSQLFSQRLRQANGRLHTAQIFVGKVDFVNFSRFMLKDFPLLINEEFYAAQVSPPQLDRLLADGWRHFGEHFFRYNIGFHENDLRRVLPLRIRLKDFTPSKSQRRTLKKNQDTQTVIRPIEITAEKEILFETHKNRFKHSVPDSIYDFLSFAPAEVPCRALEVCVYQRKRCSRFVFRCRRSGGFGDLRDVRSARILAQFRNFHNAADHRIRAEKRQNLLLSGLRLRRKFLL
jgi:hypothetical protein